MKSMYEGVEAIVEWETFDWDTSISSVISPVLHSELLYAAKSWHL